MATGTARPYRQGHHLKKHVCTQKIHLADFPLPPSNHTAERCRRRFRVLSSAYYPKLRANSQPFTTLLKNPRAFTTHHASSETVVPTPLSLALSNVLVVTPRHASPFQLTPVPLSPLRACAHLLLMKMEPPLSVCQRLLKNVERNGNSGHGLGEGGRWKALSASQRSTLRNRGFVVVDGLVPVELAAEAYFEVRPQG